MKQMGLKESNESLELFSTLVMKVSSMEEGCGISVGVCAFLDDDNRIFMSIFIVIKIKVKHFFAQENND